MGLFSFLNKNKQEGAGQDGPYHSRDDDDDVVAARARSKRASSAGEPAAKRGRAAAADPVLPEKKRARRRLVGAIALALAVAIGLPMILDSEPRPLTSDIDIRIPSKDKAPPQRMPAPVAASEALDQRESIVDAAPPPAPAAREVAEVRLDTPKPEVKPEPKPDTKPPRTEPKPAVKPAEPKPAEPKPAVKPDTERALAILEDKPVAAPSTQKYVVQVAALASQEKANELQGKLKEAGIPSFAQKGTGKAGELIRIRVGPFTKEEGEKIRAKLVKLGLSGSVVPNS